MLTNPAALPHAVSSEFTDTLFEADGSSNGRFDTILNLDDMFVPAFSLGDLTVGVSVHCSAAPRHSSCDRQDGGRIAGPDTSDKLRSVDLRDAALAKFYLGRYVRDSRKERILVVSHEKLSQHGTPVETIVLYMRPVSSTKHERIRITCDGSLFAQGRYLESTRLCVSACESRFCPRCGAGPSLRCGCALPQAKPAHSLDFSRDVMAMSRYPGEFLGTTTAVAAVPSGISGKREYIGASLVSSLRLNGFSREVLRHRELKTMFQAFAVQLSLSERSPVLAVMPPPDADVEDGSVSAVQGEPDRLPVTSWSGVPLPDSSGDGMADREYSDNTTHDGGIDRLIEDGPQPLFSPAVNITEFSFGSGVCLPLKPPPLSQGIEELQPADHERIDEVHLDFAPIDTAQATTPGFVETSPTPHFPLPAATMSGGDAAIQEMILRDARRRQQNREAAARSNARRKKKNDGLKRALAEASRRREELRAMETRLRAENLELRRRLNSRQQWQGAEEGAT
jgi:hypothetical protein